MTILNQEDSILVIIDVQEKLLKSVFNKEQVARNSEIMAKAASILDLPIVVTEQYPKGLGATIDLIKDGEFFEKTSFNALAEENIQNKIKSFGRKQVILFGIETHICVYQTAIALLEQGFQVTVAADACGSRHKEHYIAGLECLKSDGIQIKPTEMILFELLKSSKHSKFKNIQGLIK